jgi:hypothetical protein
MTTTRRDALRGMLFGAGYVGLRALATGLPASFFLNPRKALAAADAGAKDGGAALCSLASAQFFILSTSGSGDPTNAYAPGTYDVPFNNQIQRSSDSSMAPISISISGGIGGGTYTAGKPWGTPAQGGFLPQTVLDKTTFWHIGTQTFIHPNEGEVLRLMDATAGPEMLPSIIAKLMAPCLGTVQPQPVCLGAQSPSEDLTYNGSPLPFIPPLALRDTLPQGAPTSLQTLRENTMKNVVYPMYKGGTPAQKAFISNLINTQQEVAELNLSLLQQLSMISDNSVASQIQAAVALLQMNVSPVISIHVPFGGDNHSDQGLATEMAQHTGTDTTMGVTGVPAIAQLMAALGGAKFVTGPLNGTLLSEKVTFMSLNVFGRGLILNGGPSTTAANGRPHNGNHHVAITIGNAFKPGVIGGLTMIPMGQQGGGDVGCNGIDPSTGLPSSTGAVTAQSSLQSFGQTVLASIGVPDAEINAQIPPGNVAGTAVIRAALP